MYRAKPFKRIEVKQIWTVSALGVLLSLSHNFVLSQLKTFLGVTPLRNDLVLQLFTEAGIGQVLFLFLTRTARTLPHFSFDTLWKKIARGVISR